MNLLEQTTKLDSLRNAWSKIKSNGLNSVVKATAKATREFDRNSEYNLKQIQRKIRNNFFEFAPQTGILKKKSGKGFRGIVTSPIENRIVERAILDCLQEKVPFVASVLETPTSIGGVPNRGVGHGLALVQDALKNADAYYIRSDISGFFDNISRTKVIQILSEYISDDRFINLLARATTVILSNEIQLGENRKIFPEGEQGVAQGSPLSALFGNILLHDFDLKFNARGITCIRFIDDFILIGEKDKVTKAFANAKKYLAGLGLSCHDPFDANVPREKAQTGEGDKEFVFLGYKMSASTRAPSETACSDLISKIKNHVIFSKKDIKKSTLDFKSSDPKKKYIQTLFLLDKIIVGWGHAFSYSNSSFSKLDTSINKILLEFHQWFEAFTLNLNGDSKRRVFGVSLLKDIPVRNFSELPFKFKKLDKLGKSANAILASTDGSRIPYENQLSNDIGYGGWAVIFHDPYLELYGRTHAATNNQMELRAVIEALKYSKPGDRIHIRTDSQYIYRAAKEGAIIKKNILLWREIESLCSDRKVSFEWIEAHVGDKFNELADKLANEQAKSFL